MKIMKLKPFNLEAAKAGAKVVTRDGRSVRIICTDLKNDIYPVVALIPNEYEREDFETYTIDGKYHCRGFEDCRDLFIAQTKRQGWVNLRRISDRMCAGCKVFPTKQDAEAAGVTYDDYVATVPVEWEE